MTNKAHLVLGVLNGDDVGHEIVPASVEVASAAAKLHGLDIEWRPMPVGRTALAREALELARLPASC